jgi:Dyp-type peroxidase family
MIELAGTLDLEDPAAEDFLEGIQGNIIKGHGRDFTGHILLKMTGEPPAVRRWIVDFATPRVTSAAAQLRSTIAWRAQGGPGDPFAMFLLSADGYRHLGFTDGQLPRPSGPFSAPAHERYFRQGMKGQPAQPGQPGQPAISRDPPVEQWEPPYRQQIDAMVLLADDDGERMDRSIAEVVNSITGTFEVRTIERGRAIKQQFPRGRLVIEHFGFQDGVSQPIMIQQDLEDEIHRRGNTHWDPGAPLSLALAREPGTAGGLGSFMVFRKLEQDVKAFWEALRRLSQASDIRLEDAGAMAVGRFRDGTPAVPVPASTVDPNGDRNDFHFQQQDPDGAHCPFHAHIRKTNPRGDLPKFVAGTTADGERAKRIVRRGITYGKRPDLEDSTLDRPSEGVGLLFMCFQSNLDQFVIQQEGSDSNRFVKPGTGVDAVIGQHPAPEDQTWPSTGTFKFQMANFVRMRGGEYFFAPSMSFLKGLTQRTDQ